MNWSIITGGAVMDHMVVRFTSTHSIIAY